MISLAKPLYREGVGIMLLNKEKKVFVARRIDNTAEAWQMPQGGIDRGEEPKATAFRELKEEIGTNNARVIAETKGWISYDLPDSLASVLWGGRYRGQTQKWFLMEFLGKDDEIDIDTEKPEFLAWKWVEPKIIIDLIVDFKKDLYRSIIKEFSSHLK